MNSVCQRLALHRFYSISSSSEILQQWRNAAQTAPKSVFDDEHSPVDLSEDNDAVNRTRPNPIPLHRRKPSKSPTPTQFKIHRDAMQKNFPDGWNPPKKLSREAMEGLRELHHLDKEKFSTPVLAEKFRISPEAVRRILKSKWEQPKEKREKLAERDRQHASLTRLKERLKERMEADRLTAERTGQAVGVSSKDRFTFQ